MGCGERREKGEEREEHYKAGKQMERKESKQINKNELNKGRHEFDEDTRENNEEKI